MTDKGRVRSQNQDSFAIELLPEEDVALCVICDGMGGAKAGNIASGIAVEGFMNYVKSGLASAPQKEGLSSLLRHAASYANNMVYEVANVEPDCGGMGTTLVAAVATGEKATVINIGDSRAYLINSEGIQQISKDHSLVEDMIDRGDITREEASRHPDKNLITRAIGIDSSVNGDIFRFDFKKGELILLCSDGLTNLVDDLTIWKYATAPDKGKCCLRLIMLALELGAPDNVTIVLLEK